MKPFTVPTMKVKVLMLAFGDPGQVREVEVPAVTVESESVLDDVFRYGQNENQPQRCPSVSKGDVIEYNGHHLVASFGFQELTEEQLQEYTAMDRRDRYFYEVNNRDDGTCEMCGKPCEYDSDICLCDACQPDKV
jgi:hypothetical protein